MASSLDHGAALRAPSPANSGRDSPILRIAKQQADQENAPKDKASRRYFAAVERVLASFDTAQQEWADYISFLQRLLKALQSRPPEVHTIPESYTVATRLAQCLSPALPSGMHQKALEVYSLVFEVIGKANLERDLHLYLPGLSPVLTFASLTVRPIFLQVLESHVLNLDAAALRGPQKAILLSLLPGLEDERSEDFDQVVQLLDKLRFASGEPSSDEQASGDSQDSYFWQCFFLATITNPSRRQGALSYLVRELPNFADSPSAHGDPSETSALVSAAARSALSPEPGLLIRCLAAGLSDSQLLVQRGFLDLLVSHLPLNSSVLQKMVPQADIERLVFAAIGVVLRRDMSLNRRLWLWLLGPESKDDHDSEGLLSRVINSPDSQGMPSQAWYFKKHGLRPLARSIRAMFAASSSSPSDRAKPFRLCLSLMDRWEVGGLLIPDVFIPALRSAFEFSKTADKGPSEEVIKSANNFFDGVESGLIWEKFNQLAEEAVASNGPIPARRNALELCSFIIQRFNIREEDMIMNHIPQSSLFLLAQLQLLAQKAIRARELEPLYLDALEILDRLILLIPPRAFSGAQPAAGSAHRFGEFKLQKPEITQRIKKYYEEQHGGLLGSPSPFPPAVIGNLVFRESVGLLVDEMSGSLDSPAIDALAKVVCILMLKIPSAGAIMVQLEVFTALTGCLRTDPEARPSFRVVAACASLLVSSHPLLENKSRSFTALTKNLERLVVESVWEYLAPSDYKHHVEAVRCLWQIESISYATKTVEAMIATLMVRNSESSKISADNAKRFAVLWNHSTHDKSMPAEKNQKGSMRRNASMSVLPTMPSDPSNVLARPLFLLLDSVHRSQQDVSAFVFHWLHDMPSVGRVFSIILDKIRNLKCLKQTTAPKRESGPRHTDIPECLYYVRHLEFIMKYASEHTWASLAGDTTESIASESEGKPVAFQVFIVQVMLRILDIEPFDTTQDREYSTVRDLYSVCFELITALLRNPFSQPLVDLKMEDYLLRKLLDNVGAMHPLLQPPLLDAIVAALQLSAAHAPRGSHAHIRKGSKDFASPTLKHTFSSESNLKDLPHGDVETSLLVVDALKSGFSSAQSRLVIDNWVTFLVDLLPLYSGTIAKSLVPLVECLCAQSASVFNQMARMYRNQAVEEDASPEPTLIGLLNALESLLANAHERLLKVEGKPQRPKSPDQSQGFFGNMVQGVFTADAQQPSKSTVANSKLTFVLCLQDAVRCCFSIWCWGLYGDGDKQDMLTHASYGYSTVRMRNRARRLLEHLFAAEALECLETLATIWCRPSDAKPQAVLGLLNVLNGSKPKHTIPAIFNALYSRTNPGALDPSRQSSLTSELQATELVAFLVEYIKTVDDDAMDEIWNDCLLFLKDVLGNPLPHNHILPSLLVFTAILAEKVDNTNFGEQKRMRRELGDVFSRLLAATFTTRPMGFLQEPSHPAQSQGPAPGLDFLSALESVIPQLKLILVDNDRVQSAINSITANVTGPTIRAKAFPSNIDQRFLGVLEQLTKVPQAAKFWKKDVGDALNDNRFFAMPVDRIRGSWMPIMEVFIHNDYDRMVDIVGRIPAPTTAGIVFGVGATSARNIADRAAQLNLRRISFLVLSSPKDSFAQSIKVISEKITELMSATPTSQPSAATRADVFVLLRALSLKLSPNHLAPLWPMINSELQNALSSVLPESQEYDKYTNASVIQACKLLDTLIALDLDEFQLYEWLFISDTIDAIYRPPGWRPLALVDGVAENLGRLSVEAEAVADAPSAQAGPTAGPTLRRPILDGMLATAGMDAADMRAMQKQDLAVKFLRPFFGQLSLLTFEATYGMLATDAEACMDGLLKDLFEDGGE